MLARILHLVRFDLRSLAPVLGAWFGVLALESLVLWVGPPAPSPDTRDVIGLDLAVIVMRMALTVVLVAGLVHRHPLVGTSAFWRTRPVSRPSLVASKLATAILLTVGVPFAWFTATFLMIGLDGASAIRAAGFIAVEQAVVATLAFALAAVSSNLAQIVVGGVATMLLFTTGLDLVVRPRPRVSPPFVIPVSSGDTIELVLGLTLAVAFVLAATHQYLTLRTWRTIPGLMLIVLGYVLLLRYPVWRVVPPPVAASQEALTAPELEIDRASMRSEHFVRLDERGRTTGVRYYAQLKDAGPSGAVILAPKAFESTLTFPDGAVEERYASPPGLFVPPGTFPDATLADQPYASIAASLGAALLADPRDIAGQRYGLTFLEVSDTAFLTRGREAARLEMAMSTVAYRYRPAARLPLTSGARSTVGGSAYTFNTRDRSADRVVFDVRQAAFRDWTPVAPTRYLVHNTGRREALLLVSARERTFRTTLMLYGGLLLVRRVLEAQLTDRPSLDAVDEGWLRQAEFVVAAPEMLGTVERMIRLDHFVLDPISGVRSDPAGALTIPGGGK